MLSGNRLPCHALATLALFALSCSTASALETRSYVIGWFTQANNSQDNDCPGGLNPDVTEAYRLELEALGKSKPEIERLMLGWQDKGMGSELADLASNRGRIDGKPVNAYANPEAAADLNFKQMPGKLGYGFNLDDRQTAEDFQDPQTHEQGVDNQLFRALGCIRTFRGTPTNRPTYSTWLWTMLKNSMPAWLISISGDNLDKDGEVTITFDRALERRASNTNGEARPHMTFRVDADPRSHHVFRGQIRNGEITITEHGNLRLLKDTLSYPELNLQRTHLRLAMKPDGSLDGILGGYQPWREIYFAFALGGFNAEVCITGDSIAIYYLLKKAADFDPDSSGQNRAISASYRIEAVPAFVVPAGPSNSPSIAAR
jgi:hypothetical protein